MNGVKISDKTTLKFSNRDEADRARKVVSSYKKTNPSAGDKVVMRLCGLAKRMKGASVKEIIAAFEIATSDHIVKEIFT